MLLFFTVLFTAVMWFVLYRIQIKSLNTHEEFVESLPSFEEVRKSLHSSFTGYVFCVDPYKKPFPEDLRILKGWAESLGYDWLVINATEVFKQDLELVHKLQPSFIPLLVEMIEGKRTGFTIEVKAHHDPAIRVNINELHKRGSLETYMEGKLANESLGPHAGMGH